MPNYYAPVHQLEIRYTPLIGMPQTLKDIVAPYIERTNSIQIQNENLFNQQITLNFDNDSYSILVFNDRIIFVSNIGIDGIADSNSFIKEPFFSIYEKITQTVGFISNKNILFYIICIDIIENEDYGKSLKHVNNKYLQIENCKTIIPNYDDVGISLSRKTNNEQLTITFGPYRGLDDFSNRRIQLTQNNLNKVQDLNGTFIEYKLVLYESQNFDFKKYKAVLRDFYSTTTNI